ncbi:MAG: hypothetical protein KJZ80_19980 [Hyphomicrobiaceae bacterium]|nr:hypothetical protein [Hyphomicrobiaceae bacterium]
MSLQRMLPWLVLALVASVVSMIAGAGRGLPLPTGVAAAVFAAAIVGVGLGINKPLWVLEAHRVTGCAAPVAAQRNARLIALAWAWGAAAMAGVYTLGGLRWYHAWQYGSGMALLGAIAFGYGFAIARARDPATSRMLLLGGLQLTLVQGVAAACGVLYLLFAGKLMSFRADWAASQIFLFGGLAIAALSAMAVRTQRKLMSR